MIKKKEYMIVIITIGALVLNMFGKIMATKLTLPIWCDSVGTFLVAYIAGPVCGGIVGFTTNIIYGIHVEQESIYCIVGAMLGIVVGHFSKNKVFDTQFSTMTFGMDLAILSTIVAVFINTVVYDGMSGNIWGNQVMLLCMDNGFPKYVSFVLGQFCVEFLDKLLSVEIVYLLLKVVRYKRKNWAVFSYLWY